LSFQFAQVQKIQTFDTTQVEKRTVDITRQFTSVFLLFINFFLTSIVHQLLEGTIAHPIQSSSKAISSDGNRNPSVRLHIPKDVHDYLK
jgi:hypothetical protein